MEDRMIKDPMEKLPAHVQQEIRLIWKRYVEGGKKRFKEDEDRRGGGGQNEISALLNREGIREDWDGKWEAIIEYGRSLYRGKRPPDPISKRMGTDSWQVGAGGSLADDPE